MINDGFLMMFVRPACSPGSPLRRRDRHNNTFGVQRRTMIHSDKTGTSGGGTLSPPARGTCFSVVAALDVCVPPQAASNPVHVIRL